MARSSIIRCSDCHQRILWVRMVKTGRSIPVDPDPTDRGNVVAIGNVRGLRGRVVPAGKPIRDFEDRYMPHPATCTARPRRDGADTRPPAEPTPPAQAALFDGLDNR